MSTLVATTAHGRDRARERLGIKRRAVLRAVRTAWECGVPVSRVQMTPGTVHKMWRGSEFVFSVTEQGPMLITVIGKLIEENRLGRILDERYWAGRSYWRKRRNRYRKNTWMEGIRT
jgi:hypothetical protein